MTKPIGRIWFNKDCVSGYITICLDGVNNICIKFAADSKFSPAWIYPPKAKEKEYKESIMYALEEEVKQLLL